MKKIVIIFVMLFMLAASSARAQTTTHTHTPTPTPTTNPALLTPSATSTTGFMYTPIANFTPDATATACSSNSVMGNQDSGVFYYNPGHDQLQLFAFRAPYDTVFYDISVWMAGPGRGSLVVYADNGYGTVPTTLLSKTAIGDVTGAGWVSQPLVPPVVVREGESYWLGFLFDVASVYSNVGPIRQAYQTLADLEPPQIFSGVSDNYYTTPPGMPCIYVSGCPVPSPTWTPVGTWFSPTHTPTKTPIVTFTTPTQTPVGTWRTSTPTYTPTTTSTPTYTYTMTYTFTRMYTNTHTFTWTRTVSGTVTPQSPTPSYTHTPTYTVTPTYTRTFTPVLTDTWTPSWTRTPTVQGTPTPTWTGTWWTFTPTRTRTPTSTDTPTFTFTRTWTPPPGVTLTHTPSFTAISTFYLLTSTSTPTALLTPTNTISSLPPQAMAMEITSARSYPNPSNDGTAVLQFELVDPGIRLQAGDSKLFDPNGTAELSIYSTSMRLLWRKTIRGLMTGSNTFDWDGKDAWGSGLSNGTYIYRVLVSSRGNVTEKRSYVVILR